MDILWKFLIIACILLPLVYVLYYFGFMVTKAAVSLFSACYSLPARWAGKFQNASGYMRRNFVVFKKYSALSIEIETVSGTLDFEVKRPDSSILSPVSGTYGRDASALIDVSQTKRCSVTLKANHFNGQFCITLQ